MGAGNSKSKVKKYKSKVVQSKVLSRRQTKIILKQQSNSLCQISAKKGKGTGFLCKIPNPVLITSNHTLNESQIKPGKEINIDFTDGDNKKNCKTIKIDNTRLTYTIKKINGVEIDTTIIELRPDEDGLNGKEFLEIDKDLMNEGIEKLYKSKDIYLIYFGKEEEAMSTGIINKIDILKDVI